MDRPDPNIATAERHPSPPEFPSRISRRLSVALSAIIATVLLVGGISVFLARSIQHSTQGVRRQTLEIQAVDDIHLAFHHLFEGLHWAIIWRDSTRAGDVATVVSDLQQRVEAYRHLEQQGGDPEAETELAILREIDGLAREAGRLAGAIMASAGTGAMPPENLRALHRLGHIVPGKIRDLNAIHQVKIQRFISDGQGKMQAILSLYVAFAVLGSLLLAGVALVVSRTIVLPLRRLVAATGGIAQGDFDRRVAVTSRDEIGQLSRAFNVMADRLQSRERDLRAAHGQLEQKVRETQALYRIGTEISGLRELDRILRSVVEKARELLRTEAAAICMFTQEQDELVALATSGPAEAFQSCALPASRSLPAGRTAVTLGDLAGHIPRCTVMQPEFLRAHLAAPLCRGDTTIGMICVCSREPRTFTAAETELLTGLATQAAIAIENTRLYEEVRSLATLEERERIAREMHDGLAQALGLLHLKLRRAEEHSASGDPPHLSDALQEMTVITGRAYEEVRQSIFGLRTMVSRGLGLIPTLTEYLHDFSAQNGIDVELEVADGRPIHLSPASEVQLVRIIQEALTNVRKHAGASRAWVRFQREDPWVRVTVEDNGRGFDPVSLDARDRLHFGLQTMRERAEGLGGKLEIDAAPGRGTRIVATLPGEV